MATTIFSQPPSGNPHRNSGPSVAGRRPAALAVASALWPSSSDLFAEDFLTDSLDEDGNELGNLLAQIQDFSESNHSGPADLFKFRELLVEAAHSVFMRWKVLHQLRTMALTDDLTSLYNRRGFLLLGMHYLRLALRNAQPLCLYFADVDRLKIVNDCCGHVQGDALLVACGEILKMTFRESDIIARIGGDEFAVLVQGGTSESRDAVLGRLQSSIDAMNRDVFASYRLSLSVGVARFDPLNPVTLGELLSIADRELMFSKRSRRNVEVLRERSKGASNIGSGTI
ncbi:MAG TPA: GGDEF domain-containing protein [Candidatus Dormibacteraeota bacterium]|nr:GGDEF domain-containing protein [Candidatus Dormibacteraeota bacterium]